MNIFKYFDLGLMPDEPELGSQSSKAQKKKNINRLLRTFLMYVFVWLGVVGQKLLEIQQIGTSNSLKSLGQGELLVALVIATAIFPLVFPKIFVKMPARARKVEGSWLIVQVCVAFQNGFFWQALLSLIIPK